MNPIKDAFGKVKGDIINTNKTIDKLEKKLDNVEKNLELQKEAYNNLQERKIINNIKEVKTLENKTENTDDKSLKQQISELKDVLIETKQKRSFKLPWKARLSKKKVTDNWVSVIKINDNNEIKFDKYPIDEQTAMIDGTPRIFTPEEMLTYKGKPLVILPSWSIKPFSKTDNYEETMKQQYSAQGYKLALNRLQKEAIMPKSSFGGMGMILLVLAVIGLGYWAYSSGYFS